jgi:hypothetical protein
MAKLKIADPPVGKVLMFFGIEKLENARPNENYRCIRLKVRDGEIIETKMSQPDIKICAINDFKIKSFRYYSEDLERG